MTQANARPPSFVVFSSSAPELPDSYLRYLANGLRESFELWGTPIRIHLRKPKAQKVESAEPHFEHLRTTLDRFSVLTWAIGDMAKTVGRIRSTLLVQK